MKAYVLQLHQVSSPGISKSVLYYRADSSGHYARATDLLERARLFTTPELAIEEAGKARYWSGHTITDFFGPGKRTKLNPRYTVIPVDVSVKQLPGEA